MSRPLITVKTLIAQSREGTAIDLPADAIITPAAQDWLQATRLPVRRNGAGARVPAAGPTVYVIGDAKDPSLQTLLPILERRHDSLTFLPCQGNLAGCLDAVRRMCEGLAQCSQRRGIVIVRAGGIVSCVANRNPKVRAAVLTRPSDLYGLQKNLDINVLILEQERLSLRQMQASIETFLTGKGALNPAVEAVLAGTSAPGAGCTPCNGAK
ncbi:MAG: RpiB/LacA/LacB family sugar-phosphate isomerase [Phycisphaerae bacterium]|nr:RpiB/LacA/LacB family sugar-phosphate isomerase [Phycisphaerae bacterium]